MIPYKSSKIVAYVYQEISTLTSEVGYTTIPDPMGRMVIPKEVVPRGSRHEGAGQMAGGTQRHGVIGIIILTHGVWVVHFIP